MVRAARGCGGPFFKMAKKDTEILILAGIAGAIVLLLFSSNYKSILKPFLQVWEGFSPVPKWDISQWSWGYGTRVPGSSSSPNSPPGGTITQTEALNELWKVVEDNYSYLAPMITRKLNPHQLAAFLSFAYNEGPGNADNLVNNINSGNDTALFTQWRKYVYAGGIKSNGLINRREAEIKLWQS